MNLTRRKAIMGSSGGSILPPEYQQVKYLESTGTQYIDTLVKSTTTLGLDITLAVNSLTGDQKFFGTYLSGNNGICLGLLNGNWRIGGGFWGGNDVVATLNKTNIRATGDTWTINGVTTTSTTSIGDNNSTILCFATRYSSSTVYTGSIKLYNLKLFDNGILIRNFIPCYRISDKELGLYDIVEQSFYTNQGTGTFITKDFLPNIYQEVEYLQSDGTQYIDTNVATSALIGYDIEFLITPDGAGIEQMVIGSSRWSQSRYFLDMNLKNGQTKVQFGIGNYFVIYSSTSTNIKYRFLTNVNINSFGNYTLYENGILVASGNETGDINANTNNLYLFSRNNDGTAGFYSCMQLFACKIYDNGLIIRNFIPCYRKSDNEPGMYDIINNVFYTNAGTGTFIVGNDIN